ncbi:MAG: hypothetical protein WB507_10125 [Solirubrobacterales bacterium]
MWLTSEEGEESPDYAGFAGLYELSPFPSQTLLDTPSTSIPVGATIQRMQVAVDETNGELFVANSDPRKVDIYDENGTNSHVYSHSWTGINGLTSCFTCDDEIHDAVDNSHTYSNGRIYLSLSSEEDVEAFDAQQRPVDFPATADYIEGNTLTGTPSGPFVGVGSITVDSSGNIYVSSAETVDEFASTGIFLRAFPGSGTVAVDPTTGNVLIGSKEFDSSGNFIEGLSTSSPMGVNSEGYLYAAGPEFGAVSIFKPDTVLATVTYRAVSHPSSTSGALNAKVEPNPNGSGEITTCKFEYGEESGKYNIGSEPCEATSSLPYVASTDVAAEISGLTTDKTYHYRVALTTPSGTKYGTDQIYTPHIILGLRTEEATNLSESGATLNGSFLGNGEETEYYFEWGLTTAYGHTTAKSKDAGSLTGESPSATLEGLSPYSTYHYRVVATNGDGASARDGEDQTFTTLPGAPSGQEAAATGVHSDRAALHAKIDPNGANTTVRFEYVDSEEFAKSGWTNASTAPGPEVEVGMSKEYQSASAFVSGLSPSTLYHFRAVADNEAGSGAAGAVFKTFGFTPSFSDPCPNAHVRQQTGASLLLDCRAYELVSAANTGGYDVESSLVPGETPFGGYPEAEGRVLYGVHDGGIPGIDESTNRGVDPYLATRTDDGWTTSYVGIPANSSPSKAPFGSTLLAADPKLETFAFGGPEICAPCFPSGIETGIPLRLPDGELIQGMTGPQQPGPTATSDGYVAEPFSADGTHFVFASTSQFESTGNQNTGNVSIYDRDFMTRETHVVSKKPTGGNLSCEQGTGECHSPGDPYGISELGISKNGSHVLIGQLATREGGIRYWHLYMNVGDSTKSTEITPSSGEGVLFDGMTADGSKVFFSSKEHLTHEDEQHSGPDIFMWSQKGEEEGNPLKLISTGDAASCEPAADTAHVHWNTTGSEKNCGAVAVGGGGGVASEDGTIYFLSPELLDGTDEPADGIKNAPNLYISRPGSAPHFISTLESSANSAISPPVHPFLRSVGSTFEKPAGVAITHRHGEEGDVYVLDITSRRFSGSVQKFDSSGHPVSSFGSHGVLVVPGMEGNHGLPCQLAVNQSTGNLYVPDFTGGIVQVFSPSGSHLASIAVGSPSGVAVDQANEDVYVSNYYESEVDVFGPGGNIVRSFPTLSRPTGVAVNSLGTSYVVNGGGQAGVRGVTGIYDASGSSIGQLDSNPSKGVAVDPSDEHVYVDEGDRVSEFDASGKPVGTATGSGLLSESISLAADSGTLAISNPGSASVAIYGSAVAHSPRTDNPLVLDSVSSPEARHTADFQVSPSGDYAAFPSALPLAGYDSASLREIYRYNAVDAMLECASCNPTGEQATGEATLPSNGLGLADDGRVFFNSTEGLVDRDLNETEDAYEWEPQGFAFGHGVPPCEIAGGCLELISTGASPFGSSLLGVSSDGTDAYFFTRDKLVEQDENGSSVKIYDARELGGFPYVPTPPQCKASDECHGRGSEPPPPPEVKSNSGTPIGNEALKRACKAGLVEKHGECVNRPSRKKHHKHKHHRGGKK